MFKYYRKMAMVFKYREDDTGNYKKKAVFTLLRGLFEALMYLSI